MMTKQHSLRDIAGGLAVVSSRYPQFAREDVDRLIDRIFIDNPRNLTPDVAEMLRKEIGLTYAELMASIDSRNAVLRDVLIDYVRKI
jgi:hypothetical protein